MTRFGTITVLLAASTLGGTVALAQTTTPQTTPSTSAGASSMTTATAPAATATSYTDADIDNFAGAAIAVQKIQQDASVADADKQTKMASAVTSSGLTADKFNAIAKASQADPALMKRIQTAAAAKMQASPSTAPATGSTGASGSAGATGSTGTSGSTGH